MTTEFALNFSQVENIYKTMISMKAITARGNEWDYVEVFNERVDEWAVCGTLITSATATNTALEVLLRIEHMKD